MVKNIVKDIEGKVLKWAEEKGILDKGSMQTQLLKFASEYAEYESTTASMANCDAIGDMTVVLTSICYMHNKKYNTDISIAKAYNNYGPAPDTPVIFGAICDKAIKNAPFEEELNTLIYSVISLNYNFFPLCYMLAYYTIQDRTGKLNEHGNFVKDE
jgi:hypothetical protein